MHNNRNELNDHLFWARPQAKNFTGTIPQHSHKVGILIIPMLQVRKEELREVKQPAQAHRASPGKAGI